MVYNHLKDKVKSFLQPFAESGQAVGAEDIKAYFEKLRGDEQGIEAAAVSSGNGGGDGAGDNRREQSGKRIVPTIIVETSADHRTSRLLDLDWIISQISEHVRLGYGTCFFRHRGVVSVGSKWTERTFSSCLAYSLSLMAIPRGFISCHR